MGFGTSLVIVVLIVSIARVLRTKFEADGKRRRNFVASDDTRHLQNEVRVLKDRIAVLERLATDEDNSARLDREIEKLRDRT